MPDEQRGNETTVPPEGVTPPDEAPATPDERPATPDVAPTTPDDGGEQRLFPRGNPTRPRSLVAALFAFAVPFLLMATDGHHAVSIPLGTLACVTGSLALLDFLGTFDDPYEGAPREVGRLLPRLGELTASIVVVVAVLRLAVAGRLPWSLASAALLITASSLWVVTSVFRLLVALGAIDGSRPLTKRWGFWLIVAGTLLYLPLLGSYSLSDPWETHYGEVAREMLARDDWISTWWAQENWFWSKPVLDFWLQALSFSLFGVRFQPDQMLAAATHGLVPRPEWAARLPNVVLTLVAGYALYRAVAQRFGGRAGFLGGLVLFTLPYWYVIGRQSITDMPYVAPITAALSFVLVAMAADPDATVRVHPIRIGRRVFGVSAYHLLFTLILCSVVPQILYLASRHLTLVLEAPPYGFRAHLDEILYGSPGNCGLPGNDDCRMVAPADPALQPGLLGLGTALVMTLFLWANRGERRLQRLAFLSAWYAVALSAAAKGAPGLVLPIVVVLLALTVAHRFRDFARAELVGLVLLFVMVCLPWYTAMVGRHGSAFTDRLLFHDMYKRAFVHVHDTNTGDDVSFRYYVWQLGYGLFPWTGLATFGLLSYQREGNESRSSRAEALAFLALWFVIAFSLFSSSLTKFHHYVLPAVPPIAVLTGILLDRMLPEKGPGGRRLVPYLLAVGAAALLLPYGLLRLAGGSLLGTVPGPGPAPLVGALSLAGAAGLLIVARRLWPAEDAASPTRAWDDAITGAFAIAAAALVLLVGRDLFSPDDPEGPARLTQLASYNYRRPWPATLDFKSTLLALSLAASLATIALSAKAFRHHAVALMVGIGVWAAAWGADAYVVRAAPHWGQRDTIIEYYRRRRGPEEPFVAYQMNWKGENFYTGNHLPAFVASGAKFKSWLAEQRDLGTRVVFFTTEHSRESSLKADLGKVRRYERLTNKALDNKFFVARVEL